MDYLLLAIGSDSSARAAGIEVAAALRSLPGGAAVASRFDSLSSGRVAIPPRPELMEAIERVTEPRTFRAAGWAEFTRVFAAEREELVFRWTALRGALDQMANDRGLSAESRLLSDKLLTSIASGPRSWPALEKTATDLLASLGR